MPIAIEQSHKWERTKIVCFSHLRWKFVFQRPQHLLSRFARHADVVFFEEPILEDRLEPHLAIAFAMTLGCVLPHLCCLPGRSNLSNIQAQRMLLDRFLQAEGITHFTAWYYTPMALAFSRHLHPSLMVYDCMDELSAFQGAPPELVELEQRIIFARRYSICGWSKSL